MIYEEEPIVFPSTNTLLDAFQPQPETGDIFLPLVIDVSSPRIVVVKAVGSGNFDKARQTLEALVSEGACFVKDNEFPPAFHQHPVPATEGAWSVGEYVDGKDRALSFFNARSKRFIRASLSSKGGFGVSVGWNGIDLRLTQTLTFDPRGQWSTGGYHFEFMSQAVEGLRSLMGWTKASGVEMALELASLIYASDQYTPDESGCSLQVMGPKNRWHDLPRSGSQWRLPENLDPNEPFVVGTRNSVPRTDRSKVRLPVAEAYWEANEGGRGHLLVRMHNFPGERLFLRHGLRSLLWDGALRLLFGRAG